MVICCPLYFAVLPCDRLEALLLSGAVSAVWLTMSWAACKYDSGCKRTMLPSEAARVCGLAKLGRMWSVWTDWVAAGKG